MFLAAMRDKSRKAEWEHRPPTHLSADGMDAWYMMQSKREKELKQRKKEAEELLRGYRGPYFGDDASMAWSPRSNRRSRTSFGGRLSESLVDPLALEKRRQSTMPRIEHNFGEDPMTTAQGEIPRNKLAPDRTEFLNERHHYDGTHYERADGNSFETGKSIFRDSEGRIIEEHEARDPGATYDQSRFIDISASQNRLNSASKEYRLSTDNSEREDFSMRQGSYQEDHHSEVSETVWRDFISPGRFLTLILHVDAPRMFH